VRHHFADISSVVSTKFTNPVFDLLGSVGANGLKFGEAFVGRILFISNSLVILMIFLAANNWSCARSISK
jgi:hypothetical protein